MRMDNATYWALKLRERESREAEAETRRGNNSRRVRVPVIPTAETAEEPSYRELQAQAKDLEIPANQSADDLKAAIEEATEA